MTKNRGIGWECLHVAIDDASRLAYTEVLPNEKKGTTCAFVARAIAWFERHSITVARLMSDNGSAYKSHDFRDLLARLGIRHVRTRPYTPRTNGKAFASCNGTGRRRVRRVAARRFHRLWHRPIRAAMSAQSARPCRWSGADRAGCACGRAERAQRLGVAARGEGRAVWPAAGFVDTEVRCLTGLENGNAKKEVQPRVQA